MLGCECVPQIDTLLLILPYDPLEVALDNVVSLASFPLGDLVGCKPEAGYQQSPVLQTFEPRGEKGVCGKKFVACAAVATVTPLDVSLHEVEAGARAGVLYRSLGSDLANV